VTSAGSGIIISAAERTAISTATSENQGTVTVHSDVTSAGSGIIISAAERTAIGTITNYLPLAGGTMTGAILASAGTVSLPSYSFSGDPDTGAYSIGANSYGIATGGTLAVTITDAQFVGLGGITPSRQLSVYEASTGSPCVIQVTNADVGSGSGDGLIFGSLASGVGLINNQENTTLTMYTNNVLCITLETGGDTTFAGQVLGAAGTALLPSHSFSGDPDTGAYSIGANSYGIATGGTLAVTVDSSQNTTFAGQVLGAAGTALLPSHSFSGDPDTGAYSIGANSYGIATGGTLRVTVDSSGNSSFSGTGTFAGTLNADNGILTLGSTGNNGIINANFSCRINIDADNNGSSESFTVGHNQTAINSSNRLFVVSDSSSSGETAMWVYDQDNATLERVTVGAADSGGTGYKVLRIPN
jgi:hypothetical protein